LPGSAEAEHPCKAVNGQNVHVLGKVVKVGTYDDALMYQLDLPEIACIMNPDRSWNEAYSVEIFVLDLGKMGRCNVNETVVANGKATYIDDRSSVSAKGVPTITAKMVVESKDSICQPTPAGGNWDYREDGRVVSKH
jgi:hypothetical protein